MARGMRRKMPLCLLTIGYDVWETRKEECRMQIQPLIRVDERLLAVVKGGVSA